MYEEDTMNHDIPPHSYSLQAVDPEIAKTIKGEVERQNSTLELIASENFVSEAILEAAGSVMTNKYAEGLPGRRYYGGCEFVDQAESLAIERAKELFGAEHANVQPHSGSQANMAVYITILRPGETMLGMDLAHGGHLTHGHHLNFSGKTFRIVSYGVRRDTETIDYGEVERIAIKQKPRLIVAGASAYPRTLDFERFAAISKKVGALLMVDMAHIAGLVATGIHPSPFPHADFVTTTTHKTLRGPRGGTIFCRAEYAKKINATVFPGIQGGPLMHVIAAKAVCFREALLPDFRNYQQQIVTNAKVLADTLQAAGFRLVSGGTDTHLLLIDVASRGITGKEAEKSLERAGITVNKNAIPFDTNPPMVASGIRIGTPAITTRNLKEPDIRKVGQWISTVLGSPENESVIRNIRSKVEELTKRFPLYENRRNPI